MTKSPSTTCQPKGDDTAAISIKVRGARMNTELTGKVTPSQWARIVAAVDNRVAESEDPATFQARTQVWMQACFGAVIAADRRERNHRFLEEALELVQSLDCTASEAHQLVDYVFSRPVGEPAQELGGTMVTLAALATPAELDMRTCAEVELARVWSVIDKIREKQAKKPPHSPLPA